MGQVGSIRVKGLRQTHLTRKKKKKRKKERKKERKKGRLASSLAEPRGCGFYGGRAPLTPPPDPPLTFSIKQNKNTMIS